MSLHGRVSLKIGAISKEGKANIGTEQLSTPYVALKWKHCESGTQMTAGWEIVLQIVIF